MPGVSYTAQHSPDMENWNDVPVGEIDHWTDTNATGEKKFYRILEE